MSHLSLELSSALWICPGCASCGRLGPSSGLRAWDVRIRSTHVQLEGEPDDISDQLCGLALPRFFLSTLSLGLSSALGFPFWSSDQHAEALETCLPKCFRTHACLVPSVKWSSWLPLPFLSVFLPSLPAVISNLRMNIADHVAAPRILLGSGLLHMSIWS